MCGSAIYQYRNYHQKAIDLTVPDVGINNKIRRLTMDKSKLPKMGKGKVVTPVKKKIKKRGGVGGVLDSIKERNRKLKEAMGN
jgi:hypothetical protein